MQIFKIIFSYNFFHLDNFPYHSLSFYKRPIITSYGIDRRLKYSHSNYLKYRQGLMQTVSHKHIQGTKVLELPFTVPITIPD